MLPTPLCITEKNEMYQYENKDKIDKEDDVDN